MGCCDPHFSLFHGFTMPKPFASHTFTNLILSMLRLRALSHQIRVEISCIMPGRPNRWPELRPIREGQIVSSLYAALDCDIDSGFTLPLRDSATAHDLEVAAGDMLIQVMSCTKWWKPFFAHCSRLNTLYWTFSSIYTSPHTFWTVLSNCVIRLPQVP